MGIEKNVGIGSRRGVTKYFDVGGVKFLKPMMMLMTVMLDDKHDTFDNL